VDHVQLTNHEKKETMTRQFVFRPGEYKEICGSTSTSTWYIIYLSLRL